MIDRVEGGYVVQCDLCDRVVTFEVKTTAELIAQLNAGGWRVVETSAGDGDCCPACMATRYRLAATETL